MPLLPVILGGSLWGGMNAERQGIEGNERVESERRNEEAARERNEEEQPWNKGIKTEVKRDTKTEMLGK